jgi:hypothetical protein
MQMKHKQTPEIGNLLLHGHEGPDFVLLPRWYLGNNIF